MISPVARCLDLDRSSAPGTVRGRFDRLRHPVRVRDQSVQSLDGLIVSGDHAFSISKNVSAPATTATKIAAPAESPDSLLKLLLFGFIGGFILNLMPCVLPVISLKIFGFIQHAGDSRARIFGNGLAFRIGIFAWFIGLALLMIALKSAGREITWAFQFTNPYFVVAMSAVVLVFALNLFGVFEITLPAAARTGLLGWSAREGYAGSFFQGVFATVLATPCTAPFSAPRSVLPSRNRPRSSFSCSSRSPPG